MMKFFRKYNKHLLAGLMVLLMVVFLGGNALYELARPSINRSVATTRFGEITFADQQEADAVTSILSRMRISWEFPVPQARKPLELVDWILLKREARSLGLQTDEAAVLASFGADMRINDLARNLRARPDLIVRALAELETIRRMAEMVSSAAIPSEAEIRSAARKVLEKVRLNAVLLPARAFEPEDAEFSEEEMLAQFNAYREREPGEGLEFGYYVPPALKLQYVVIDREKLASLLRIPNLEKRAKALYDEHPDRPEFARPPEERGDEDAEGPPPSPYLSWEEAKDIAVDLVRKEEAEKVAARIAQWIIRYAGELWLGVERKENGYREAPEAAKSLSFYEEAITKLPRNLSYPEAIRVETTDFFSEDEAREVPGIGSAWFRPERGGMGMSLPMLAFRSEAIVPEVPKEAEHSSDYLAMFETCRFPVSDAKGNLYVFRVVDRRPGHVPESIDEVRDRVVADLRLMKGFEEAQWRATALKHCEEDEMTLKEAYEADVDLARIAATPEGAGMGYFELEPVARMSRYQAATGQEPDTIYLEPGVGMVPAKVVEAFFRLDEIHGRYEAFELKKRASMLVVEWVETLKPRADEFMDMRDGFVQQYIREKRRAAVAEWLDPDNIRARAGFALATR
ncbi:MAG: hypothetical protein D6788_06200 [Planctomycetota bacterium]|nr:MAG: hypothetical protein D6788_06200 [Planctomycetota bacterium]